MVPAYVVISPVKDEEKYIETTVQSMLAQTLKPIRWIVVDDGSGDRTPEIIEHYTRQHAWISLVKLARRVERGPGSPVVRAFNAGFEQAKQESFDFVVKMDCDLRLPATYFEQLLERFRNDPRLGIASGVYLEETQTGWQPVPMPEYHAAGASKVIRAKCFGEIGGFVTSRGWDTVDEIRAQTRGALHRMVMGKPPLLSGLMLLAGYLKPLLRGQKRLVTKVEARYYQRAMNQRIWASCIERIRQFGLKLNSGRAI